MGKIKNRLLIHAIKVAADMLVMLSAYVMALVIRFDFSWGAIKEFNWHIAFFVVASQVVAMHALGCYRIISRYISIGDLPRFFIAVALPALFFLYVRIFGPQELLFPWLPYSVIVLNAGLAFVSVCLLRIARRALNEQDMIRRNIAGWKDSDKDTEREQRVLLLGAGTSGVAAVKDLHLHGSNLNVVGFLDDDPLKQDTIIQGVKVLGVLDALEEILVKEHIDQVIVAMFTVSRETIHRITAICNAKKIRMRIIPGYYEVISGNVSTSRIREVNIEDLLGRDPITLDEPGLARFITGKCVLITGAGGSIGSELARQVARLGPARLLLLERAENAMYEIHRELRTLRTDIVVHALVADVADEMRMKKIFERYHPAIVIHAAAHKHVPMMEMNPGEAIKNNALASRRLGELALDAGVECMVLISTDKAVNPTSVMGASKRLAELALQDLNGRGKTRFVAVRFGNVLGSTGSVVPLFREQIRAGGPVTVTHPDMVRYFMTIPEAVGLVLQAAAIAEGGEVFILDMGEPVKIVDLAEDMIRLSGFKPYEEISIVFSGIRPGEKLFEELGTSPTHVNKTSHPRIMIAKIPTLGRDKTEEFLKGLRELCVSEADDSQIRKAISKAIPEASLKIDG